MKFKMLLVSLFSVGFLFSQELTIYSHRHYDTDKGIFKLFSDETGIKINVVQAKANELAKRLEVEGKNSKADLFMTADAGNLEQVRVNDLFVPVTSKTLDELSPKELRGKDNTWYAFTTRARIIVASKDRVKDGAIKTYEDLTKPEWKGKVLVRSSNNVYNISLLSSMIDSIGEEKAREWASGIVKNLARTPKGADRDQVRAIYAKEGDVAISNSYYLGHLANSKNEKDVEAFNSVKVIFPNQDDRGTHINVSGIGVLKTSKNKEAAVRFIEFMLSPKAQEMLTNQNYEYPVNKSVKPNKLLQSWGEFKIEKPNFEAYYGNAKESLKIFDEVQWK
ncbi:Fe(3+) ABC transporter substrate-binding protein [Helicobacter sp. WB40]|uniref:Fe(3+) ABC transporter substrate-binding protein n=1 Tax=Helicobacter sp. WB40 TaxID=3004130 RepID=UPI0022EC0E27|nr:Fe(3+) ABC transporter substrate-binding protein [Helicobacter sp. WB40]MDA3966766.1 Fe(3+) ABC transporter substrate-binding protein [Helicobacter sp. WB40]